ncbi:hypothetical protein [Streptacidiphilus fuscans]|uniref:Uncharacterized protein n=1 Tax=Streptacidiphilus fuscans TaxID=2789292 RepID=A0A931B143_9ACTN|nr:hypothetical protein [Streptacidiphilus fuscans]MBF9066762.1 hypothetical protein [Streptacidiphilus fuscans]
MPSFTIDLNSATVLVAVAPTATATLKNWKTGEQVRLDADTDAEQRVIREPGTGRVARRALVLWQIGEGRRKPRAAGLV